jgi:hypothetical protein
MPHTFLSVDKKELLLSSEFLEQTTVSSCDHYRFKKDHLWFLLVILKQRNVELRRLQGGGGRGEK